MRNAPFRVAHGPDSDDVFVFYALLARKLDTGNPCFEHEAGIIPDRVEAEFLG